MISSSFAMTAIDASEDSGLLTKIADTHRPLAYQFDVTNIKGPQLLGIVAGCVVFTATILVVVYLLYASGSFEKLAKELQEDLKDRSKTEKVLTKKFPQDETLPELYEHLLQARDSLATKPHPPQLSGKSVTLRVLTEADINKDSALIKQMYEACSGEAFCGESDYDPERIWGWLDTVKQNVDSTSKQEPASSIVGSRHQLMTYLHGFCVASDASVIVINDNELGRPIGMLCLVDNCPRDLSVRIGKLFVCD